MNRREARYLSIFALYHYDIEPISIAESLDVAISFGEELLNLPEEEDYTDCKEMVYGAISHLEEIDQMIKNNLVNWTLDRLSYVDRALIRLAVYEFLFTDTPSAIVINEALEITKELTALDDSQTKFNNKLLDRIRKEIEDEPNK